MNLSAHVSSVFDLGFHLGRCPIDAVEIIQDLCQQPDAWPSLSASIKKVLDIDMAFPVPDYEPAIVGYVEEVAEPQESGYWWTNPQSDECIFVSYDLVVGAKAIWSYLNKNACDPIGIPVKAHGKIEAIKYLRSKTDFGLYVAKCIVEEFCDPFS